MPLVSITRLRLRSWTYLPGFFLSAIQSDRQARRAKGNLSVSLLPDARYTFWTCSVWTDEAAMKAFMLSGPHRKVMPKLLEWCDEASVGHWTQESAEPPTWEEVHQRMQREGRASKVKHPSEAQLRFDIPAPKMGTAGTRRFK